MNDGTCYVGRLIVHPDLKNQGIGTKLLKAIKYHFSGTKRFELFTGHRSERTIHLYEKNGYLEFRRERASKNIILVFMEKIT
ncbi:MAG: GNAT family N-acetyltransferase [Thermodesulfovibrionales bacterium]